VIRLTSSPNSSYSSIGAFLYALLDFKRGLLIEWLSDRWLAGAFSCKE